MQVWIVQHIYNAGSDNSIPGVFASEAKAYAYVKDRIKDERKFGSKNKWTVYKSTDGSSITFDNESSDGDEAYEISCHTVIS